MKNVTIPNAIATTDKQNSFAFRYGKTGSDIKLYYDTAEDLEQQIGELMIKAPMLKNKLDRFKEVMMGDTQ